MLHLPIIIRSEHPFPKDLYRFNPYPVILHFVQNDEVDEN